MTPNFSKNGLQWYGLIFMACLAVMVWMILQTQTFDAVMIPILPSKLALKFFHKKRSKISFPIRVHIFNKLSGFFPQNVFAQCKEKCVETSGTDNYNSSKYVLFLGPRIGYKPPLKLPGQIWVLFGHESPIHHSTKNFTLWKNLVNVTMSHRRDSDIYCGYGGFKKGILKQNNLNTTFLKIKNPKFTLPVKSAWMVSNCYTAARRDQYVKLLIKEPNISVDIYGGCGSFKCPRSEETSCMNRVDQKYPYYLAFENSLCVDYITEKSFKVYSNNLNVIPVVRGDKKSYDKVLPLRSYINANDFTSVKQLTQTLKDILKEENRFTSFFEWRKYFMPWNPDPFCKLCDFIIKSENTGEKKFYEDYTLWLNGYKKRYICHDPSDLK